MLTLDGPEQMHRPVRCAVLGKPVAHSLSPVLHRAAYDVLGLPGWEYAAIEVGEDELDGFLAGLDESWRGLSLTMPLKRVALGLLDSVSPVAELAGAVNTVLLGEGLRVGDNTDVPGMVAALRERLGPEARIQRAVVLGGGATAASTLLALADLGCEEAVLLVRDPARAEASLEVAARRGGPAVTASTLDALDQVEADLVVSTVPTAAQTPALLARVAEVPVVFEMVYADWPSPLARTVLDAPAGRVLVSGLDLLVHQAVLQVALMARLSPDHVRASALPAMRAAGEQALAARSQ